MSPDEALREVCLLAHRLALASLSGRKAPRDLIANLRVQLWRSAFAKATYEDRAVDTAMWRLMRAVDADRQHAHEQRLRALLTSPEHGEQDEQRGPGRGL